MQAHLSSGTKGREIAHLGVKSLWRQRAKSIFLDINCYLIKATCLVICFGAHIFWKCDVFDHTKMG